MSKCDCDCVEKLAANSNTRDNSQVKPDENSVIYQTSLMSSLLAGVYRSERTLGDVFTHGEFGLGTFDDLDGEMIAFDGEAHQIFSDGSARVVSYDQHTPFAVVTKFNPSMTLEVSFDEPRSLEDIIDRLAPSQNHFCSIRLDGNFELVRTRTVHRQTPPFKPLVLAVSEQKYFDFRDVSGTLIGFRSPPYTQGVNVAGYHVHFITEQRDGGGHVLEYRIKRGKLQLGLVSKLLIDLPHNNEFDTANLNPADLDESIRKTEA